MKKCIIALFLAFPMSVYGAQRMPGEVLDLTNWKITLPIDNAKEIKQPELNDYENKDYFYVNEEGDGVVFTAPVEGSTTSGSGYPRSELRQMINNGRDKASWSTQKGTNIMEITQAITHIPDVKKHVVVGQIHDGSDDVIVYRLENKKLFIEINGKDGPVVNDNYVLGQKFKVKFVAGGGKVMCYYNGKYVYTHNVKTDGCFFKAGMYTQSNLSKGDKPGAYGQNVIYKLNIESYEDEPKDYSYYEDGQITEVTTQITEVTTENTEITTENTVTQRILGDVTGDNKITAQDSSVLLSYVLNNDSVNFTEDIIKNADVNNDGKLTGTDAANILSKVLNDDFMFIS